MFKGIMLLVTEYCLLVCKADILPDITETTFGKSQETARESVNI